jgi:lysophospholipid acyltransferase (LPLAT)-like uncharacterized protein
MSAPVSSPPQNPGRGARKPSGGVVVPHAPRWFQRVGAWFVFLFMRTLTATLRYRWSDNSGYFGSVAPGPVIYCVWHNRLGLSMTAYYSYAAKRNPTAGLAAMASASKDGGFLAAILECFRVQPVRGSSSRRGPQALLELTSWAERGWDLAITPDGPRGPRYKVQEGVIYLAQVTGLPIIPFSCRIARKIIVRSWDRFQIPLPFSRCEMYLGKAVIVPREASGAEREQLCLQLERTLLELSGD